MLIGVLCALAAAAAFAGCSVLQHLTARSEPRQDAGLLLRLLRRPMWWAGGVLNGVGVALQAAALAFVPITVVAPVRLAGLPMALPATAAIDRRRLRADELGAALMCAAGGAAFVLLARAAGGQARLTGDQGLVLVGVAALVDGICWALARREDWRFVALATSGGVLNGLNAATLATVSRAIGGHDWPVIGWAGPELVAIGLLALLRTQQGLQCPAIGPPLAAMTIAEPVAAVIAGVMLLGESLPNEPGPLALQVISAVIGLTGAGLLRYLQGRRARLRSP